MTGLLIFFQKTISDLVIALGRPTYHVFIPQLIDFI